VAPRRRGHAHSVRRRDRHPPAGRELPRARALGLRQHAAGQLSAAAVLPVLRAVPQAGRQAGRPGAGHAPVPGRVHRRAEGQEFRLLRRADRARFLAVGVHPGRAGRRDLASGAGARLPGRGGAGGSAGPAPQYPRRPAHGGACRDLDRSGGRLRRHADGGRQPELPAAAAGRHHPAHVPDPVSRAPPASDDLAPGGPVRTAGGRAAGRRPPRRAGHPGREAGRAGHPAGPVLLPAAAARGPGTGATFSESGR